MIVWRIRWRMIFEPACWLLGHVVDVIHGLTAFDRTTWYCKRCLREKPTRRTDRKYDRAGLVSIWSVSLDWDGNELSRTWMGGRA